MKTCVVLALFLMAGLSLGDIQKRILGGRPCTADESKQFVFLETEMTKGKSRTVGICSGSVVGDGSWVLTAKHCDGYGTPFTIKGNGWTETSNNKHPYPSGDIMLIKMKVKKTPIALATTTDCTNIMNNINSNTPVKMVLVARDTDAKDKHNVDKILCGEVNVEMCKQKPGQGPCFTGINFNWDNCQTCGGDSGGGYIYKSGNQYKLYGVFSSSSDHLQSPQSNSAVIACENNVRKWIEDTMNKNP